MGLKKHLAAARTFALSLILIEALAGCGGGDGGPDDGGSDGGGLDATDDGGGDTCTDDSDCDDGAFCTGEERCRPDDPAADESGCLPAANPACAAGQTCDEEADACLTECDVAGDADGDGHDAVECGGDDCDDSDPNRFPGNTEVCDSSDHDEDCDPSTFGFRDQDMDGEPDAECCNVGSDETLTCGTDCDDVRPGVSPTNTETCDEIDNDCDGEVDEGVIQTWYRDADEDGHGSEAPDVETMQACTRPTGFADSNDDCDDTEPRAHPGLTELCDPEEIDEDCDGTANPEDLCTCTGGDTRDCIASGVCATGTETCDAGTGTWGACSIVGEAESCDGKDNDCDGDTDEGLLITCYDDEDDDGYATGGATERQVCPIDGRDAVGNCPVDMTNLPPVGSSIDCDDDRPDINPGESDTCNMVDDDCDGIIDEGTFVLCYTDADNDRWPAIGASAEKKCPIDSRGLVGGCPVDFTNRDPADGEDCDDDEPAINPGETEVCDAAMVDENCDGEANPPADCDCTDGDTRDCQDPGVCSSGTQTCGSTGTWGACSISPSAESCNGLDDDCNGTEDDGAGFVCVDNDTQPCTTSCPEGGVAGQRQCASDCMSFDACVATEDEGPTLAGSCNGCDDDGDGSVDENFTCRLGQTQSCTTSCGTSGQRDCQSTCEGYGACRASAETCNYCDDNVQMGLQDELGLASETQTSTFARGNLQFVGDAPAGGSTAVIPLHDGSTYTSVGGVWLSDPVTLGYDTLTLDVRVTSQRNPCSTTDVAGGWAIVIMLDTGGSLLGSYSNYGVPINNFGFAAQWRFNGGSNNLAKLRGFNAWGGGVQEYTPEAEVSPDLTTSGNCSVLQRMVMTFTPDWPWTSASEFGVRVEDGNGNFIGSCSADTCAGLQYLFTPGTDVRIGVTGTTWTSALNELLMDGDDSSFTQGQICAGF